MSHVPTSTASGLLAFVRCCSQCHIVCRVALLLVTDLGIRLLAESVVRRTQPVAGPNASEAKGIHQHITFHLVTSHRTDSASKH
jgi:hypothetical protein